MALFSPKCTSCGASLPPREEEKGLITCDYCGCRFEQKAPPPPPRVKPPRPPRATPPERHEIVIEAPPVVVVHRAARRSGCAIVFAAMFMMVMVGVGAAFLILGKDKLMEIGGRLATQVGRAAGGVTLWDSVGGPPVPVTIGGEAAFIGRVRHMPDDALEVAAFRPTTGEAVWTLGDLGTYSEGYQHTRFTVAAGKLLVSDAKGRVRIASLTDGHVERVVELSDKVQFICRIEGGKAVWLDIIDERPLRLDPETGATEPMPRPVQCPESQRWRPHEDRKAAAAMAPPVEGFSAARVLRVGSTAVAAGVKTPGTAVPQAVGFDPVTKAVAWRASLPAADPNSVRGNDFEADDLNMGRYVAAYGVGTKGWHVAALDAKTGDRVWDVALRRLFAVDKVDDLVVSKSYVYVVRTSSLDVLDLANGKRVATIGDETYEDDMD